MNPRNRFVKSGKKQYQESVLRKEERSTPTPGELGIFDKNKKSERARPCLAITPAKRNQTTHLPAIPVAKSLSCLGLNGGFPPNPPWRKEKG